MEILCTQQKRIDEQDREIRQMNKVVFPNSESVASKLKSRTEMMNDAVRNGLRVGKKKHRELYVGINDTAFIDGRPFFPYREDIVIKGYHLAHYKWSWKLNKAVKVKG